MTGAKSNYGFDTAAASLTMTGLEELHKVAD